MGISQEDLAERAEVHRTYICDVEGGTRNVSLEIIERLARALEVSTATLLSNRLGQPAGEPVAARQLVDILFVEDNADDAALTL